MDFVVIDLVLWRLNIKEDEEVSFVHSNTFPYLKKEIYRIILTDTEQERAIVSYSQIDLSGNESKGQIKFRIPVLGRVGLTLYAISDSYVGQIHKVNINLSVTQKKTKPTEEEKAKDQA